jgi:spore germination protein GerM
VAVKRKKGSGFGWLLFWLAFLLVMAFLFVANRERIQESLAILRGLVTDGGASAEQPSDAGDGAENVPLQPDALTGPAALPDVEVSAQPPVPAPPAGTDAAPPRQDGTQSAAEPAKTLKRTVYLIRLDRDGDLVAARVERSLPASDTPMKDALEAAIRGPSANETKRSLLSLIPEKVKILGAAVQGSTAYINFSEDFLFNTYGIEGYAGQLRQVVWTATEFSTVKDVQILIEGKRVDYLGEGIWIGSPINRSSL